MNQLNYGIVPDISKISKVTPVFKTDAATDPGNYRPIAGLSPFAKILERLVYNELNRFPERENILFKHQFGFRKNYSIEQAILELTDNLKMKIDSNEAIICSIFLELSKAFDTVNHQILLQKLYRYGIRGVPLQWFKSYLESRTQYVEVKNVKSNLSIQCVVPQGSNLGPLRFLIYIKDMPKCLEKANIRTFADDTTLLYSSNSLQDLEKTINEEFNHLLSYCLANKNFL